MAEKILVKFISGSEKEDSYLSWLELVATSITSPDVYADVLKQIKSKGAELIFITADSIRARFDGDHTKIAETQRELENEGWLWP